MKTRRIGRFFQRGAAVLLGSLALFAPPVRAQTAPAADRTALAGALRDGAAAATRADYAACAAAYERAYRLAPEPTTAGALGLCEEALGRHVAAYDHLRLALEAEPAPGLGGGQGLWKRFDDALIRLERRVARAILVTSPSDAEVFLDGFSVGPNMSGRYITLLPGAHVWTARRAGHDEASFVHVVRGGDLPDVRLVLRERPRENPCDQPCDEACQAKIRRAAELDGAAKLRAELEQQVAERVRLEVDAIYRARVDPSLALVAGGLLSAGLTADPGPGFWLGGEARWGTFNEPAFALGLEVRTLLPTWAATFPDGDPLEITQITAALVPCLHYKWVAGCVFADVGMLIGGGRGTTFPDGGVLATAALGPRLAFQLPFAERFALRAFAELRISPVYTGFFDASTSSGTLWVNPLASGLFGLGVSFGEPVRGAP